MPCFRVCALGSVIGLVCFSTVPAGLRAQSANWTNTAGGTFSAGGNWSTLSVPGPADTATFDSAGVYQVDFTAPWTNAAASFGATSGEIALALAGRHWTIAGDAAFGAAAGTAGDVIVDGGNIYIGNQLYAGEGNSAHNITLRNGARVESTNNAFLCRYGTGNRMTVSGSGTRFIAGATALTVSANDSRLIITNGGFVQLGALDMRGTDCEIHVTGSGSTLVAPDARAGITSRHNTYCNGGGVFISDGGLMMPRHNTSWHSTLTKSYTLSVTGSGVYSNAADVGANGNFYLDGNGRIVAEEGGLFYVKNSSMGASAVNTPITLRASGPGSRFISGTLYSCHTGAVNMGEAAGVVVTNQGYMSCATAQISSKDDTHSTMLVADTGSVFEATSSLRLAGAYTATNNTAYLRIADGGRVTSPTWYIGYAVNSAFSTGIVEITGADAVLHAGGTLYAGSYGTALITVSNQGRMHVSNLTLGHYPASSSNNVVSIHDGYAMVTNHITVKNGLLSMVGTGGVCEAGQNLALEAAGGLRFVAAAGGVSPVTVKGALQVDGASTLELDMRAYRSEYGSSVVLASYGSMPAGFDESNIAITGVEGFVDQVTGNKLTLRIQQGSLLMVR